MTGTKGARESLPIPPMPEGFTDRSAWDAIHWRYSVNGSVMDDAVIGWQRGNQERVRAAAEVAALRGRAAVRRAGITRRTVAMNDEAVTT